MNSEAYQEGYVTCPYNPSHRLLKHRFITHLVKCRRNHPDSPSAVCAFNSSHIVPAPELKYHMDNCPDRHQIDRVVTEAEGNTHRIEINFADDSSWDNGENWDQENTPCYNPAEYCENKMILRRLDIASKAQRRDWHQAERRRFQEIDSSQPAATQRAENIRSKPQVAQVRQPKEEMPAVITSQMRALTTSAQTDATLTAPPLSEILTSARAPGEPKNNEEKWEHVRVRGRGRGVRKNKN
ncbi:gametocyte-specific factor 1 homolog [Atheta coriaria]|uniref:gametocyte-specific factor 1 homolog n=1 Tax=Dalotia coriaria TaxID=877792 RepID=UPI0031F3813C